MKSKKSRQVHQGREGKTNILKCLNLFTSRNQGKELLSYGCSCVRCELNWNSVVLFVKASGNLENPRRTSQGKGNNQQEPQLTCSTHVTTTPGFEAISPLRLYLPGIVLKSRLAILVFKALGHEDIDVLGKFCAKLSNKCLYPLGRFSYDLEMKTREQNRNNKRVETAI